MRIMELSKKDFIITKIIIAIGLIPFSFYMLQPALLKGSLLDSFFGLNIISGIFSIMVFFLTLAILCVSICFTEISGEHKKIFFRLFNNFFDSGIILTSGLFLLGFISILSSLIYRSYGQGIQVFLNENLEMLLYIILIIIAILIYKNYLRSAKKRGKDEQKGN